MDYKKPRTAAAETTKATEGNGEWDRRNPSMSRWWATVLYYTYTKSKKSESLHWFLLLIFSTPLSQWLTPSVPRCPWARVGSEESRREDGVFWCFPRIKECFDEVQEIQIISWVGFLSHLFPGRDIFWRKSLCQGFYQKPRQNLAITWRLKSVEDQSPVTLVSSVSQQHCSLSS